MKFLISEKKKININLAQWKKTKLHDYGIILQEIYPIITIKPHNGTIEIIVRLLLSVLSIQYY